MCTVSNVGDDWSRKFTNNYHINWPPTQQPYMPTAIGPINIVVPKEEWERLKADVEQMKKELLEAKKKDIAEGNPDCEMEDKVALLKKIAALVGVSLEDIFK